MVRTLAHCHLKTPWRQVPIKRFENVDTKINICIWGFENGKQEPRYVKQIFEIMKLFNFLFTIKFLIKFKQPHTISVVLLGK